LATDKYTRSNSHRLSTKLHSNKKFILDDNSTEVVKHLSNLNCDFESYVSYGLGKEKTFPINYSSLDGESSTTSVTHSEYHHVCQGEYDQKYLPYYEAAERDRLSSVKQYDSVLEESSLRKGRSILRQESLNTLSDDLKAGKINVEQYAAGERKQGPSYTEFDGSKDLLYNSTDRALEIAAAGQKGAAVTILGVAVIGLSSAAMKFGSGADIPCGINLVNVAETVLDTDPNFVENKIKK